VRELKNVVERAIILSRESDIIRPEHLAFGASANRTSTKVSVSFDHEPTLEEVQAEYLASSCRSSPVTAPRWPRCWGSASATSIA
jgi:transcriptional regulator with PAS, ATPase and Fis domain